MEEAKHKWHSGNNNNMDKLFQDANFSFSIFLFQGEGKLHCLDYPEKHPPSLEQNDDLLLRSAAVWKK